MIVVYVCFIQVFGWLFVMYGVVGWQMNDYVFCQIDNWGMVYVFDGWGMYLYILSIDGKVLNYV